MIIADKFSQRVTQALFAHNESERDGYGYYQDGHFDDLPHERLQEVTLGFVSQGKIHVETPVRQLEIIPTSLPEIVDIPLQFQRDEYTKISPRENRTVEQILLQEPNVTRRTLSLWERDGLIRKDARESHGMRSNWVNGYRILAKNSMVRGSLRNFLNTMKL